MVSCAEHRDKTGLVEVADSGYARYKTARMTIGALLTIVCGPANPFRLPPVRCRVMTLFGGRYSCKARGGSWNPKVSIRWCLRPMIGISEPPTG